MLVLVLVAASCAVALLTARRPVLAIALVLVLAVGLPYGPMQQALGSSWHPATVLGAAVGVVQLLRDRRATATVLARTVGSTTVLLGFLALAVVTSYLTGRMGSVGTIVLQVVVPSLLLLAVRVRALTTPGVLRSIALVFVLVSLAEAVLVIGVSLEVLPQPWAASVMASRWWGVSPDRMTGTLSHPLVAGLWMAAAVPFVGVLRHMWAQLITAVVLLVAIATTGSRLSLVVAGAAVVVVLLRSRASVAVRVLAVLGTTVVATVVLTRGAGEIVLGRFSDDGGSSSVRAQTLRLAASIWQETMLVGRGFGASEWTTRNALIGTTFENPVIMFWIDFGGVATVLFFGVLVAFLVARPRAPRLPGARLAAAGVLVAMVGFNSLGTNTPVGTVLFLTLALAAAPVTRATPIDRAAPVARAGRGALDEPETTEAPCPTPGT